MERTFRLSGVYRARARAGLVRSLIFGGVAAMVWRLGTRGGCPVPWVVAASGVCGILACLNLYPAWAYFRERLTILPGQLIQRGLLTCKELEWDDFGDAQWLHRGQGGLRLSTQGERATIRFERFEPADRLWLIRLFHRGLPQEVQRHWDRFCLRIATPLCDQVDGVATPTTTTERREAQTGRRRRKALLLSSFGIALAGVVLLKCVPQSVAVASAAAGGFAVLGALATWVVRRAGRSRQRMQALCADALRRWDEAEAAGTKAPAGSDDTVVVAQTQPATRLASPTPVTVQ